MKVITAGHRYELANFENKESPGQVIQFIEKRQTTPEVGKQAMETVNDGTTNEEVLAVLIDRIQSLNVKLPCRENSIVLTKLEESLMWLNKRTADRQARFVEGKPVA